MNTEQEITTLLCDCCAIQKLVENVYTQDLDRTLFGVLGSDENKSMSDNAFDWVFAHFNNLEAQIYAAQILAEKVVDRLEKLDGMSD